MTSAALQLDQPSPPADTSGGVAWHNHLPAWIAADDAFHRLTHAQRAVLQAIADACDARTMTGAFGGQNLADRAKVSRRTVVRAVRRLEQLGYIVVLQQGGTFNGRNLANIYGIPPQRGSLDHRRAPRPMVHMHADGSGVHRPESTPAGAQVPIVWPTPEVPSGTTTASSDAPAPGQPPTDTHVGNSVGNSHQGMTRPPTGYDRMSQGVVTECHTIIPSDHPPMVKNHGASRQSAARPRKPSPPKLPHIEDADLTDPVKLAGIVDAAVNRGVVTACEHDRLMVRAAAAHAIRIVARQGGSASALFASIVNRQRWLLIAQVDEDAARQRDRRPTPPSPQTRQEPPSGTLSDDARIVRACLKLHADRRMTSDPLTLLRRTQPDAWTRERFERAVDELHTSKTGGGDHAA